MHGVELGPDLLKLWPHMTKERCMWKDEHVHWVDDIVIEGGWYTQGFDCSNKLRFLGLSLCHGQWVETQLWKDGGI